MPDNLGSLPGSFLGLVVLGRVDGELGEEFTVVVDDAHVAVGDEEHDAGAGVAAADAEVAELGLVAQGDVAAGVDAVAADAVLGGDGDGASAGRGLGARCERVGGGASVEGPVGTLKRPRFSAALIRVAALG